MISDIKNKFNTINQIFIKSIYTSLFDTIDNFSNDWEKYNKCLDEKIVECSNKVSINDKTIDIKDTSDINMFTMFKIALFFLDKNEVGKYNTETIINNRIMKKFKDYANNNKSITDSFGIKYNIDLTYEQLEDMIPEINNSKNVFNTIVEYIFVNLEKNDFADYDCNWVLTNLLLKFLPKYL